MSERPAPPPSLDALSRAPLPEEVRTCAHRLRLLPGMESVLGAIQRDVERAERRALIETYIYRGDRLGRDFGAALARAAARGVDVRLIYDPLGSQEASPGFFDELRARGVNARPYRPLRILFQGGSLFPRDHGRVIVIDDHAYTGGAAWGDEWLPAHLGGEGWYDVCLQIDGPVVADFSRLFELRWREASGELEVPRDLSGGGRYPDIELHADAPSSVDLVYERHLRAVRGAARRVWMCNAYFYPPEALRDALIGAAARGVDVQVITTGPSDLPIIKRAARADYPYWIGRGLRVFEYQPGVLHAKYAVIDEDLCTVGTLNANPTSMKLANEVNVFVTDPAFVRRVAAQFEADRAECREVTWDAAVRRPLLTQVVDHLACNALRIVDAVVGPKVHRQR